MAYVSFDNMLMYYFKQLSDLLNLLKKKKRFSKSCNDNFQKKIL